MNTCSRNGWTTKGPQNRPAICAAQHTATASAHAQGAASVRDPSGTDARDVLRAWTTGTR